MKQRIITSVVAFAILLPALIFADSLILPLLLCVCSVLAVYEMLACIGLGHSVAVSIPFYLVAMGMPIAIRYLGSTPYLGSIVLAALLLSVLYLFTVLIFSHGKYNVGQISAAFFAIAYILFGFNALIYIHDLEAGGEYVYLIAFIGAWMTDIFAYFCGLLFGRGGKHKLIPDVSPKKTVEGSVGGMVFCVLGMILFGMIVEALVPSVRADLWILAASGLVVSVVAQIGDLSMSVIKRTYGVKDYGKIFPGHGGILDRFDSVIAVSVVLLVVCSFFNLFEVI